MVSASASVLVGREFDSRPGLTKTLYIGTAAFLPDARCTEELQGTHPEQQQKWTSEMKPEIQSWRYKTVVVIKRQQQTTISNSTETDHKRNWTETL